MDPLVKVRKPLGVRATVQQQRLLQDAAKREGRSVSSFVLLAALEAAKNSAPASVDRTELSVDEAIRRAQDLMRPYRREGHSLVDEFLAERRTEAERE